MSNIVQLSEAASLGIHAMVIIARNEGIINANQISEMTGSSRNHLAKVMLTLAKYGLVKSLRGPAGGFVLAKKPEEISVGHTLIFRWLEKENVKSNIFQN